MFYDIILPNLIKVIKMTSFGLSEQLLKAINKEGYQSPTLIQQKVIPLALSGNDILAKAQTGSGKTASFVLPILELLTRKNYEGKARTRALILAPTRELAIQVSATFEKLGQFLSKKPKITCIIGGESIGEQLINIQKGSEIVVATSGRLLDIINKKQLNISHLDFFVLDEADKMLNLGFTEEIDTILRELPPKRQNLLFSATYPTAILHIASKITSKAIEVGIEGDKPTVEKITQRAIEVDSENRGPLLRHLLDMANWERVLVFMANKRATDNMAAKFRKHGFKAESFHGDLTQDERTYTLNQFKTKKTNILFATDIAARGLDIEELECVVNFDLPRSPSDYIHRIGRTGRAGKSGTAISFVSQENKEHFLLIEKKSNIKLALEHIEGFKPNKKEIVKTQHSEPIKGKRKSKKDKARELLLASTNNSK